MKWFVEYEGGLTAFLWADGPKSFSWFIDPWFGVMYESPLILSACSESRMVNTEKASEN